MRFVLKVHRKGIVVLPKRLREALGVKEGDEVVAEISGGRLVLTPLKPLVVDIDPKVVDEILHEERILEENKYSEMLSGEEASPRH